MYLKKHLFNYSENKTQKLLESLLVKTDTLDSKITNFGNNICTKITNIGTNICIEIANTDTNIRSEISQIKKIIDSCKEHTDTVIVKINFEVANIKKSQEFISKKYEKQKTKISQLTEYNKKLQ